MLFDVNYNLREMQKEHNLNHTRAVQMIYKRLQSSNPYFAQHSVESLLSGNISLASNAYSGSDCDLVSSVWNTQSTTYFTFQKLNDGMGNSVVQLIKALSFGYKKGWNFIGVRGNLRNSFGNNEVDALDFFFGNHSRLVTTQLPSMKQVDILGKMRVISNIVLLDGAANTVYNLRIDRFELERYLSKHNGAVEESIKRDFNSYFNVDFLHHFRRGASCGVEKALSIVKREGLNNAPPSAIRVVAHIRLGDAVLNDVFQYKRIPHQYYMMMFSSIRKICAHCRFYAFTSVQHQKQHRHMDPLIKSLQKINVTVYVDYEYSEQATDEALNTIAHFATADVFLAARSEFSVVSAYLNPNCVLYNQYQANFALNDWITLPYHDLNNMTNVKKLINQVMEELPACLERKLSHKLKPP